MPNNDENPKRNRDGLEDNPFIAFRRFADSQVSSLLNTVFTLPATIANYNNVHQAREACLFKKADKAQCEKLQQLEDEIAGLRHEGRECYRVGDLQEVLKKSEELMKLDRHADELRKEIVGHSEDGQHSEDDNELVQRVANRKGQEWGWDWSWGFPKPFDDDRQSHDLEADSHGAVNRYHEQNTREAVDRHRQQQMAAMRKLVLEGRNMVGDEAWDDTMKDVRDILDSSPMLRSFMGNGALEEMKKLVNELEGHDSRTGRREAAEQKRAIRQVAMRNERWPNDPYAPEALASNDQMNQTGVDWRSAYDDLLRTQKEESKADYWSARNTYPKRVPWADEPATDEPSYEYSHDHEDQHDDPPTPKATQSQAWCHPAQNQSEFDKRSISEYLHEQQQDGRELGLNPHLQKYYQDQHDQFERRRDITESNETELDVYEHVLEKLKPTDTATAPKHEVQPSILSTLTTTERSVAPDGSVTTKVVLKKRFADGREESSETVHTQRGHEMEPWQSSRATSAPQSEEVEKKGKKSGWFWSS